jgi:hypothetical protein
MLGIALRFGRNDDLGTRLVVSHALMEDMGYLVVVAGSYGTVALTTVCHFVPAVFTAMTVKR